MSIMSPVHTLSPQLNNTNRCANPSQGNTANPAWMRWKPLTLLPISTALICLFCWHNRPPLLLLHVDVSSSGNHKQYDDISCAEIVSCCHPTCEEDKARVRSQLTKDKTAHSSNNIHDTLEYIAHHVEDAREEAQNSRNDSLENRDDGADEGGDELVDGSKKGLESVRERHFIR